MSRSQIESLANGELSAMLARITVDVTDGEDFPAGVVTVIRDGQRVLMAGLGFPRDGDDRDEVKVATWRIIGGLLAWADALTLVFDSRLHDADGGGQPQPCLLGMALRYDDSDEEGIDLAVNQIIVPYDLRDDGTGRILAPFIPDEVAMEHHFRAALTEGIQRGPLDAHEAAAMLRTLDHEALDVTTPILHDAVDHIAVLLIDTDDGPDPHLN